MTISPVDHFEVGTSIVLYEVWNGKLWSAMPMIVASDSQSSTVLWSPAGTTWMAAKSATRLADLDKRHRRMEALASNDWQLVERQRRRSSLWFLTPESWCAPLLFFSDQLTPQGWYVNVQEPVRRASWGFVTMDLVLDACVHLSGDWHWKDVEELGEYVQRGLIKPALAEHLKTTATGAIQLLLSHPAVFDDWLSWIPDAAWPMPVLPPGWRDVSLPAKPEMAQSSYWTRR